MSSLLKRLLAEASWTGKDAFPSNEVWERDISDLLEFLEVEGQLGGLWPALISERPRQRNSAFAEARAAKFLADQGCRIVDWNPTLPSGRTPEFIILTPGGQHVMVEVKAPDWQAELSAEEIKTGRAFEPKDKQGEVRTSSTMDHLESAILKASEQLPTDQPTLVAIVDDLHWSPADEFPADVLVPSLDEFFRRGNASNVGGVVFLNAAHFVSTEEVTLRVRFVPNTEGREECRSEDLERVLRAFIPEA